jgi:hypothetical protein
MFIASLGFSKLAVVAFVHNLTPSELHRRINAGVTILVSLWLVCSVFVAAFECGPTRPWDRQSDRCIDRVSSFGTHFRHRLTCKVDLVECRFDLQHHHGSCDSHAGDWNNGAASCEASTEGSSHESVRLPIAVSSDPGARRRILMNDVEFSLLL